MTTEHMEPTIQKHHTIEATPVSLRHALNPCDIVIAKVEIRGHGGSYPFRVIALEGSTVSYVNGMLAVNGESMSCGGMKWGEAIDAPGHGDLVFPYTIPEDHVFVVGDNGDNSFDSRVFGAIPRTRITHVVTDIE